VDTVSAIGNKNSRLGLSSAKTGMLFHSDNWYYSPQSTPPSPT